MGQSVTEIFSGILCAALGVAGALHAVAGPPLIRESAGLGGVLGWVAFVGVGLWFVVRGSVVRERVDEMTSTAAQRASYYSGASFLSLFAINAWLYSHRHSDAVIDLSVFTLPAAALAITVFFAMRAGQIRKANGDAT